MGRALVIDRRAVAAHERESYLDEARRRRAAARAAGCNFWLFEERAAGDFVECLEGPDDSSIRAAVGTGAGQVSILHEVELH